MKEILQTIHQHPDIQIALASRTGRPAWLEQLAKLHIFEATDSQALSLWSIAQVT